MAELVTKIDCKEPSVLLSLKEYEQLRLAKDVDYQDSLYSIFGKMLLAGEGYYRGDSKISFTKEIQEFVERTYPYLKLEYTNTGKLSKTTLLVELSERHKKLFNENKQETEAKSN